MKKELLNNDKELLLKDLCARLPYGVKFQIKGEEGSFKLKNFLNGNSFYAFDFYLKENMSLSFKKIEDIKPYLFPLSSMTEEQYKKYWELEHSGDMEHLSIPLLDWLNANHFDYRGLIEKSLALDATRLNIY